jgi:hypothetical protein
MGLDRRQYPFEILFTFSYHNILSIITHHLNTGQYSVRDDQPIRCDCERGSDNFSDMLQNILQLVSKKEHHRGS